MRIIKPSFTIETPREVFANMNKLIEKAGRTCYKSEDKITDKSAAEFVQMIIKRGHESVLEHQSVTVRIICDRGVSHELVRHRIASYSQESTRYCDYKGEMEFILPPWSSLKEGTYNGGYLAESERTPGVMWLENMLIAEDTYHGLRHMGWRPEQARSVLPNSLKTEIVMTCNLREWRHFFTLRCAKAAHPQMREIAIPMSTEFYEYLPEVFGDLQI